MLHDATHRAVRCLVRAFAACTLVFAGAAWAQSGEPIKIGFSMALTGGLAPNGKSALLAQKIWEEDVNANGGSPRPSGQAHLLRRQELARGGAGDLYEAARHRQSRPDRRSLRHGADRAGHADRDPTKENFHRAAVNSEFNYPNYFCMIPRVPMPSRPSSRASSMSP